MAAVAAVIAARRAHAARNGDVRASLSLGIPPRLPAFAASTRNIVGRAAEVGSRGVWFACCLSLAFLAAGTGVLVSSFSNDHAERVASYEQTVRRWTSGERPSFSSSSFNVSVQLPGGESYGSWLPMEPIENSESQNRLPEGRLGIEGYDPLKYAAVVSVPPYRRGNASDDAGDSAADLLPGLSAAATARFQFRTVSGNGTVTVFETTPLALVFDEIAPVLTPAPRSKCALQQRGVWRRGECHRVQKLVQVCVQVSADGNGGWALRSRGGPESAAFPGAQLYGCEPGINWSPAVYEVDRCWVLQGEDGCSLGSMQAQTVQIVLRNSEDPMIRAAELTGERFDFGMSVNSQRVLSMGLLVTGGLLCLPPVVRLLYIMRGWQRPGEDEVASPSAWPVGRIRHLPEAFGPGKGAGGAAGDA